MDNYIVSARKYRPSTFRSVVGQKSLTTTLKNAIASGKLAHAYLFCGPRGVGKTSCARIFAKTINCLTPTAEGEACNGCESCQAFNEQRSYNINELDAASNNSVDDIRSLIEQVRIPPAIGKYKVFIIDEVHMLSSAAFNAFLKTLEEPPHHALFILATTEKHKVLPTILSRCQIYDFSRISIADMVEHLQYISSCEGVTAEAEGLNVIAQKADGGMRDALSVFDQVVSFTSGHITYQAVINNLNVLDYEYYFRLTECMLSGNIRVALLTLNEIINKGFDGHNIITGLASHLRDLLVCRDESTLVLFEVGSSIRERYREMAQKCSEAFLFKAIELANGCDLNYRASRNKRLLLELTLIQLCQLNRVVPVENAAAAAPIQPMGTSAPAAQTGSPVQPSAAPVMPQTAAPAGNRVVTTQMPAGVAVQTPSAPSETPPAPKKNTRPVTTSFNKLAEEKEVKTEQTQQQTVVQQNTPFTQEQLVGCWDAFSNSIDKKQHLKHTMIHCKPQLRGNGYFDVLVHNPGQQDELINNSIDILSFLRHHLKNTAIQMQVRISETNDKKLAYTSVEKYEHMIEINPILSKLREEFNLTLD